VGEFARSVISARRAHEITVDTIEQLDDYAVVALGRLFISDERGVSDARVGWLMFFEDGMLRRSVLVDSIAQAPAGCSARSQAFRPDPLVQDTRTGLGIGQAGRTMAAPPHGGAAAT
jgi:hypothetical protein